MVALASASGPPAPGKPSINSPSRSARASVGRNGAPGGMVKTRGSRIGMPGCHAGRRGRQAGLWTASRSRAKRRREPLPMRFLAGNAETQAIGRIDERARQRCPPRAGGRRLLPRPAARRDGRALFHRGCASRYCVKQRVEPRRFAPSAARPSRRPGEIVQRPGSDCDRRPADRPGAQRRAQPLADVGRGEGETESQPRQAERLAEGAQHDRAGGQNQARGFSWPSKSAKASSTMSSRRGA